MATLTKAASEAEAAYLQRCLRACETKGIECVGFVDEPACTSAGSAGARCCKLHDATTRFYTPSPNTYVKKGALVGADATGRSSGAAPSMADSNPDWTYGSDGYYDAAGDGASDDGNAENGGSSGGGEAAGGSVGVDGGRPHPSHHPSPLDEASSHTTDKATNGTRHGKEENHADASVQAANAGGRLASVLGDGALIGVAVALALSGIMIGVASTLGAQRCKSRAGSSDVSATHVKTHVDDASAVPAKVMHDCV